MVYTWHWPSFFFYIVIIIIVCLFALVAQRGSVKNNLVYESEKEISSTAFYRICILLSFCISWWVAGARYMVGMDYVAYYDMYYNVDKYFQHIFSIDSLRDFLTIDEPGFNILVYVIKFFFDDPQYIFIITSFLTLLFVYKAISNEKNNISIALALLLYMVIYYIPSFTIVAQYLAGAIILWGYKFIINKNPIKFIICVLVASSIHYAAIIALPVYFYCNSDRRKITKVLIISGLLLIWFSYDTIFSQIVNGTRYSVYITNENASWGLGQILKRLPMLILILVFKDKLLAVNPNNKIYIDIFILEIVISQFAYMTPILNRGIAFLSITQILLIPSFVRIVHYKNPKHTVLASMIVLIIISFSGFYFINMINNIWWIRDSSFPYQTFFGWTP